MHDHHCRVCKSDEMTPRNLCEVYGSPPNLQGLGLFCCPGKLVFPNKIFVVKRICCVHMVLLVFSRRISLCAGGFVFFVPNTLALCSRMATFIFFLILGAGPRSGTLMDASSKIPTWPKQSCLGPGDIFSCVEPTSEIPNGPRTRGS